MLGRRGPHARDRRLPAVTRAAQVSGVVMRSACGIHSCRTAGGATAWQAHLACLHGQGAHAGGEQRATGGGAGGEVALAVSGWRGVPGGAE
jgi:hypothetical protein